MQADISKASREQDVGAAPCAFRNLGLSGAKDVSSAAKIVGNIMLVKSLPRNILYGPPE